MRRARLRAAALDPERGLQRFEPPRIHLVQAPAKHLLDQVFLGAEVVVDGSEIDVAAAVT